MSINPMKPSLKDFENWRRHATLIQARNSAANGDVFVMGECKGERVLLKSYGENPWIARLPGRWVLQHEDRIVRRLSGISGIPESFGLVDSHTLALRFVEDCKRICSRRKEGGKPSAPPEFFEKLTALVEQMHARGIGHGDIRRANILCDANNEPVLVDFATAVCRKKWNPISWLLFSLVRRIDEMKLLKIKVDQYPELLSSRELLRIGQVAWYVRLGQFYRKKIYRPFIKPLQERKTPHSC